jgi:4-amino-4-deoxy-L-arabinose transferase-like glycosyltransferase
MGLGYSLPANELWDPLGTWAGRLPSALASVATMLMLGDTLMVHPSAEDSHPRRTAVAAALAFALSPLVQLWSRTAVSDALLSGTLALSLLCQWRCYASGHSRRWWLAWVLLATAVLTKGPVAVVLSGMTLALFALMRRDLKGLWRCIKPIRGLAITALISLPWYVAELLVEGQPFWDSFFGYHNLQRFTSVVNSHLQPWWFFGVILVVASLPFTPLLLLGLAQTLHPSNLKRAFSSSQPTATLSLQSFASCWLLSILLLFTTAATKLPSYWLPATPAAAILIALAARSSGQQIRRPLDWAWGATILLTFVFAVGFWSSSIWVPLIDDPEMPTLPAELLASRLVLRAAVCFSVAVVLGLWMIRQKASGRLLAVQGPLVVFQLIALIPMIGLGDRVRQLPIRDVAATVLHHQRPDEPIAMVGVMKPSLHFYTDQVVVYEGTSTNAFINLADRFSKEKRQGWQGVPISKKGSSPSALIVIDSQTMKKKHWRGLNPEPLGQFGIYQVLRFDRRTLDKRALKLHAKGTHPTWEQPRPERY